jgi:hypothetical protein
MDCPFAFGALFAIEARVCQQIAGFPLGNSRLFAYFLVNAS